MKKRFLLLCIVFLAASNRAGEAQDVVSFTPDFTNPFISALPERKEVPEPAETMQPEKTPTPVPVEIKAPSLTINGLIWNSTKPQAIINDRVVSVGDVVADSEIIGIYPTGVQILYRGKVFTIEKKRTIANPTTAKDALNYRTF